MPWLLAAGCVWGVIVTRRAYELTESPMRLLFIVLLLIVLAASSLWCSARFARSSLRFAPLLLLAVFAVSEWRAAAQHREFLGTPPTHSSGPSLGSWHPVTTTDLVERYYSLPSKTLRVDRLRVSSLSDIHISPALPAAYFEQVLAQLDTEAPDVLLLTGDYASTPANLELFAKRFAGRLHARVGVFAVLGNHDYWVNAERTRDVLQALGATLVTGRCEHLPERLGNIAVCGTDAPWGPALTTPLERSSLNLVLSHTPDNVFTLAEQGASIIFAGHTHGGQIRLPVLGATVVPSRFGRRFDEGHFHLAGVDLFVSAGIGADSPPIRIDCPPEILVLDLVRDP